MSLEMEQKRNLIGGEWVGSAGSNANINPSDTNDVVGYFAQADADQVRAAVDAADKAAPAWRNQSPQVRADILDNVGQALIARREELGRILSREEGKTLAEGIGEVNRAGQTFKFYAGEAVRAGGEAIASTRPDIDVEVTREPLGVVGLITPWNFPAAIPAWKVAPALAYGNTVVLKPADLTPALAHVMAELLVEAGCPAGVFNLVAGRGSVVGPALIEDPRVAGISFTGSVPVGRGIAGDCIRGMKKLQLEMGGKNPSIVLKDADLELAVAATLNAAFFSTGQRCTATSRIIVEAAVHDEYVERMVAGMQALKVGHALHPTTQIGPTVSQKQLESNLRYVELAAQEGAEVIGGQRVECATPGFFQAPAVFLNVKSHMKVAREEIFGPCVSILRADDFEEAVSIANDTEFGLSAGIFTQSLYYAREYKRRSTAGIVMVNLPTAGLDYHVPFGGRRASSYGSREQGRAAIDFYTSTKTSYIYAGR